MWTRATVGVASVGGWGGRSRRSDTVLLLAAVPALAVSLVLEQSVALTTGTALRFGIVCVLAAVAQLAAVVLRVDGASLRLGWGEVALVIGLYLLPSGWVPLAVAVGVGVARVIDVVLGRDFDWWGGAVNTATLAVTAAVASIAAQAIRDPYAAPVTTRTVTALIGAALVYYLVGALLVGIRASARSASSYRAVVRGMLIGKAYMLIGNVAVGMIAVAVLGLHMTWFIVLTPLPWVLRVAYRSQLTSGGDRDSWRQFTEAQRSLSQPDEAGVVAAGITGVFRLFGASSVRVRTLSPDGVQRDYAEGTPVGESPVRQSLLVGGVPWGELELTRPQPLAEHERVQLGVFASAVAVAVHDANTQRELRTLNAQRSHDAAHDPLTGIGNRAGFLISGELLLRALPLDAYAALVLVDINNFKEVNETLGHSGGDYLLRVSAQRVGSTADPADCLARLGGDEFALLTAVPATMSAPADVLGYALRRAREVSELLTNPIDAGGSPVVVGISAGVAVARAGECGLAELLRRADVALHQVKRAGLGIGWYDPTTETASTDRLLLLAELREALDANDQLQLLLQPAVNLVTGGPVGVEALVRWAHPRRGELPPAEFVEVLENSDLVGRFARYVIDRALAITAQWLADGVTLPISVNLSPRSLLDPNLPHDVARLLGRHRVPAYLLTLEITETVVMPDFPAVVEALDALRLLGVRLSVDDFGTGYSSLTFITQVRVDEVKVDRSFVARMADSPEAAAIVRATLDMAHRLRLRVVAEGVETPQQKEELAALGCSAAQGYHFFRPMTPDAALAAVEQLLGSGARVLPLRADEAV